MAYFQILRAQTGVNTQITTGWYSYYVNASGQLMCQPPSTGTPFAAVSSYPTTGAREAVTTGLGVWNNVAGAASGVFYGTTGVNLLPTVLGAPQYWVSAIGPGGQLLSIPAYTRTS